MPFYKGCVNSIRSGKFPFAWLYVKGSLGLPQYMECPAVLWAVFTPIPRPLDNLGRLKNRQIPLQGRRSGWALSRSPYLHKQERTLGPS